MSVIEYLIMTEFITKIGNQKTQHVPKMNAGKKNQVYQANPLHYSVLKAEPSSALINQIFIHKHNNRRTVRDSVKMASLDSILSLPKKHIS